MSQYIHFQRAESLVIFASSTYLYFSLDFSLVGYILLLFVFDISMLGYIKNPAFGAYTYNAVHSLAAPLILITISYALDVRVLLGASLLWLAHIGLDRTLGYGLKLSSGFTDTHLGKIGKR
jgi:Domain of unknown function (DUF4260)